MFKYHTIFLISKTSSYIFKSALYAALLFVYLWFIIKFGKVSVLRVNCMISCYKKQNIGELLWNCYWFWLIKQIILFIADAKILFLDFCVAISLLNFRLWLTYTSFWFRHYRYKVLRKYYEISFSNWNTM